MDYADRKKAAAAFAKKWQGRGYEKDETRADWDDWMNRLAKLGRRNGGLDG